MNMIYLNKQLALLILAIVTVTVQAQNISIDECQAKARANYPLIKQVGLIEQSTAYQLSNANKAWLPQLSLTAKASYQSDAIKISLPAPINLNMEQSKDQYSVALDVTQTVWDGGITKAQKGIIKAQSEAEKQKAEVDLYAIRDRVNQLFFGILLINEQLSQVKTLQHDLATNLKKIKALEVNGMAMPTDIDVMNVEIINAQQRETDLLATRKSFAEMLASFTGLTITDKNSLEKPVLPEIITDSINNRPELKLFESQLSMYNSQRKMINAGTMPRLGLFAQGGYGRPGLNMLYDGFSAYYLGGLRLSWNISNLYTRKNDLSKISTNQKSVEVQKETFLFNNKLQNQQQMNEINKLKTTILNDDKIIALRTKIKTATSSRVENGTATVSDLVRDMNAENLARQARSMHEIQLYIAVYQLKNQTNN